MVEHLKLNKPLSEARVREVSDLYPGGWNDYDGTSLQNVVMTLEGSDGLKTTTFHGTHAASILRHVQRYHPAIAFVRWQSGNGHFIVCSHAYHDGTFVFLDPWYGLAEITSGDLPTYDGKKGQLFEDTLDGPILGTITHIVTT